MVTGLILNKYGEVIEEELVFIGDDGNFEAPQFLALCKFGVSAGSSSFHEQPLPESPPVGYLLSHSPSFGLRRAFVIADTFSCAEVRMAGDSWVISFN